MLYKVSGFDVKWDFVGNGDGYSVKQVIETCEKITGVKIPAIEKPRRAGDPPKLVAVATKAISELGWKPQYPKLEDIVATKAGRKQRQILLLESGTGNFNSRRGIKSKAQNVQQQPMERGFCFGSWGLRSSFPGVGTKGLAL